MKWYEKAACKDLPTGIFFAERGQNQDVAKSVCFGCPCQSECLRENLAEQHGVFGGTAPIDRVFLRAVLMGRRVSHGLRGWKFGCRCEVCFAARERALQRGSHKEYSRRVA